MDDTASAISALGMVIAICSVTFVAGAISVTLALYAIASAIRQARQPGIAPGWGSAEEVIPHCRPKCNVCRDIEARLPEAEGLARPYVEEPS